MTTLSRKSPTSPSLETITLKGELRVNQAAELHNRLHKLANSKDIKEVILDLAPLDRLDSAGIAVLSLALEEFESKGKTLHVHGVHDDHRQALELMPSQQNQAPPSEPEVTWFESFGEAWRERAVTVLDFLSLTANTVFGVARAFRRGHRPPKNSVSQQAVEIGVNALPIVGLLSLLLGLIMAFQSAFQLQQFGANIFVANLVGISMAREFGPMMTGIILAGRSGSAIAAELGTMKVQEEIDALHTMGIEPTRFLIVPRIIAISFMGPALVLIADLLGIFGGFIIGVTYLDLSVESYINQTLIAVTIGDFGVGLAKSLVFSWLIGLIGCFCGLRIQGGASGVGRATTQAVVMSIFMIIVADSIFAVITTLSK